MSKIPPKIKEEDALTMQFTDTDAVMDQGGRPQSPIRGWFIEMYHKLTLPPTQLHRLESIKNYQCPACKNLIRADKLKFLKLHVKNCDVFSIQHKGKCVCYISLSFHYTLHIIPSLHSYN